MSPLTSDQFEKECQDKMLGDLWDATFNEGYHVEVSFTVRELRRLANALRAAEKKPCGRVALWEEPL